MNKLLLTILTVVLTIHLHAQSQLEFTSNCQDTIVYLSAANCSINDFSISAIAETNCTGNNVSYNFEIDLEHDGIIDSTGINSNVLADLPIGTHQISFIAFDFCSQIDTCQILVEVRDTIAPNLVLPFGIQSYIFPFTGELVLSANQLVDSNTFDNCTPFENITFSFSSNVEDSTLSIFCCDIPPDGLISAEVYAIDENGNISIDTTYIVIQDPNGVCGCLPFFPEYINVHTASNQSIEIVTYSIITFAGDTLNFTSPNFPYFYAIQHGEKVILSKNNDPLNGVTTFDLVLISKHILGLELLDSPDKLISADANQSGFITALDMVKIRSLILHITDEFPSGESWVFDPPMSIYQGDFYLNFLGIKLGDVNYTANPDLLQNDQIETRTPDGFLNFFTKKQTLKEGETYTIPMFSSNFKNILGGQFTLEFDPKALTFQNIHPNHSAKLGLENFGLNQVESGTILCSWSNAIKQNIQSDEAFYNITFTAKQDGQLSDFISINSSKIQAEAYTESNDKIEFWDMKLNFENEELNHGISVFPNPFSKQTNFTLELNESSNVVLDIFDASGKIVFTQTQTLPKGQKNITINQSDLSHSGIYFYKIQTEAEVFSGKIFLK